MTETDQRALLALVAELQGVLEIDQFRACLLAALQRAIPCDWISLNDVGPEPESTIVLIEPSFPPEAHELFARLAHENPLLVGFGQTGDGRAYRFSDVVTRDELHALALYREFYEPIGLEHQIVFILRYAALSEASDNNAYRNRASGAHRARQRTWERRQMLAVARYAGQSASLLGSLTRKSKQLAGAARGTKLARPLLSGRRGRLRARCGPSGASPWTCVSAQAVRGHRPGPQDGDSARAHDEPETATSDRRRSRDRPEPTGDVPEHSKGAQGIRQTRRQASEHQSVLRRPKLTDMADAQMFARALDRLFRVRGRRRVERSDGSSRLRTTLSLLTAVAMMAPASALADSDVADASCPGPVGYITSGYKRWAESFTVQHTGKLTRATTVVSGDGSTPVDYRIALRALDSMGRPTATVVTSVSLPGVVATSAYAGTTLNAAFSPRQPSPQASSTR